MIPLPMILVRRRCTDDVSSCTRINWKRPFPDLLICMQGCGAILSHHVVAEVDERKPNEFRDVQDLHVAEASKASADAREKRANGNENVAEETGSSLFLCEILDGRGDSTAEKQKKAG